MPLPLIPILGIALASFIAGLGGRKAFAALKIKMQHGAHPLCRVTLSDESYVEGNLYKLGDKTLVLAVGPGHYRDVPLDQITATVVVPS